MALPQPARLQDQRVCRIFFSSPFGGMEDEREILTRKYFPQIHHLCNSRGVQFVAVDMRWGITKEAGENAQVINICLRELDRSDIFVGFFGQRYGWHGKDNKLLQQNFDNAVGRHPWVDNVRHHSVTAVEFMHGHLNNPGGIPSCFAFRSKEYDEKLHEEAKREKDTKKAAKYTSESDYAAKMLDELRLDIVNTKDKLLDVHVDYKDPEEGAKLLFNTIWKYLTNDLLITENDVTESMRQLAEHDAYLAARVGIYLPQDDHINKLDAALYSGDPQPYIVMGDVGSGKSALLSNWIHQHRDDNNNDTIWIYHFVGAASGSTLPNQILKRIINELMSALKEEEDKNDKSKDKGDGEEEMAVWKLLEKLNLILRKVRHQEKKVVIVIDGLNKIQQPKKIATAYYWVPKDLPLGVFMVLSTSAGDEAAHEVFILEQKYQVIKIKDLDNEAKQELCVRALKESGKELSPYQLKKILNARLTNNPLYLMIILWELSVFGSFRLLDDKIDSLLQADSVAALFVKYLERLEEDYNTDETDADLVQQIMTSLVLSNKGLAENEIQSIFGITSHAWSPLYFALEKFTISHFGLIKLGFKELEQAVKERYLYNNKSFKEKIIYKMIEHFEEKRKAIASQGLSSLPVNNTAMTRIASELPNFQKLINDKQGLTQTLMDQHVFRNLIVAERYELLDLIKETGLKMEKIADLFLKSFDRTITNIYLKRLENGVQNGKTPGESLMHNLRNMGIILELACDFIGYEKVMLRYMKLLENVKGKMDEKKRITELMENKYYMACLYADRERYDECLELHSLVIDTVTKMAEEGEVDTTQKQLKAFATHGIGVMYLKKKETGPAKKYLTESIVLHNENKSSETLKHVTEATVNLGLVELYDGNYDKSIENFDKVLKGYNEIYFGQQPHELGNLYTNIGLAYRRKKDYDMAEKMYRKSLVIKANAVGWDNPVISVTYMNLGTLEMFRKNYQKSLEYNEKCIEVLVKNDRTDEDMYYRMALENVVQSYCEQGKFAEALPTYRRIFNILVKLNQMNNCLPGAHRKMINHLIDIGEKQEAADKLIPLIRCTKSKASEYITFHKLYNDQPADKQQQLPDDLTLHAAIKRFPNDNSLYKLVIKHDYINTEQHEQLLQFLKDSSQQLWWNAAIAVCKEEGLKELRDQIEQLEGDLINDRLT